MAWDKTAPLNSANRGDGAADIRAWKADLQTSLITEGVMPGTDSTAPKFIWTPKSGTTAARPAAGNAGRWYWNTTTKTIQRDSGTSWDNLTPPSDLIPTAQKMIFYNTVAPTGLTQVTTYNDRTLRVVVGTGGGLGGIHSISSPPSHNHGVVTENPTTDLSHTHTIGTVGHVPKNLGVNTSAFLYTSDPNMASSGDLDHTHVITEDNVVGFSPKYIDVLICYR